MVAVAPAVMTVPPMVTMAPAVMAVAPAMVMMPPAVMTAMAPAVVVMAMVAVLHLRQAGIGLSGDRWGRGERRGFRAGRGGEQAGGERGGQGEAGEGTLDARRHRGRSPVLIMPGGGNAAGSSRKGYRRAPEPPLSRGVTSADKTFRSEKGLNQGRRYTQTRAGGRLSQTRFEGLAV